MPNPALILSRLSDRIRRARSALGRQITYSLGKGGYYPGNPHPDEYGLLDCSGGMSWVLGMSRWQANKGKPWSKWLPWIETTAVVKAARSGRADSPFVAIQDPVPGCLVVYPDRRILGVTKQGHMGLVTEVEFDAKKRVAAIRGIDCSSGKAATAYRERDLSFFLRRDPTFVVLAEDLR